MKKRISLYIITVISFLIPFVSAQNYGGFSNIRYQIERLIWSGLELASPLFEFIIGDYSSSEFFFSKVLILILLIIVIKGILDKTPIGENSKQFSVIISLIVSILAIRFIQENNFFEALFIQYGVLGIAITTIIPIVIFFYFIHNTNIGTYGRKVFWTLYAVTFGAIWLSRSEEIPEIANWIYGITFAAATIFIFFDKSIHAYLGLSDLLKYEKRTNKKIVRKMMKELDDIKEHYREGRMTQNERDKERKEIIKRIRELSRD